jgi:hypothetical protein
MTPPWDLDVVDRDESAVSRGARTIDDLRHALARVDRVLIEGERVHRGRWRTQPLAEHTDRLIAHVLDGADLLARGRRAGALEELAHAATRALMLLELATNNDPAPLVEREPGDDTEIASD